MALKITTPKSGPKPGLLALAVNHIKCGITWYCDRTSLHGLRYISNKNSSVMTRLFFACACCLSFILCLYLIVLQVNKYETGSFTTTITSTAYPVWKVHFPSVTLCNINVVYKDNIKKLLSKLKAIGINEQAFIDLTYDLSALIIYGDLENLNSYKDIIYTLETNGYTTDRIMAELAHPCKTMIRKCFWQTKEVECSNLFRLVKTTHGYCCAFNLNGIYNSSDDDEHLQTLDYQYVDGAGPSRGLRLFMDVEESQYVSSIRSSYGINILVQDGIDYPDMSLISNTVRPAEAIRISVTPRIYVSSESIRSKTKQRRCLFEDEGNLNWTSIYSFKTCTSECVAKAVFDFCNCIPFYYPQNQMRFCNILDVPCLQRNRYKYSALDIIGSYMSATPDNSGVSSGRITTTSGCKCYPQCNERIFDLNTDRQRAMKITGYEFTILTVYYNTLGCIRTERNVYYTWDVVLANIGGIFGLCLGGSIISVLESVYFLCKLIKFNKNKPSPELDTVRDNNLPGIYISDFKHLYQNERKVHVRPRAPIVVKGLNYH